METKKYSKECPQCKRLISFGRSDSLGKSIRENCVCKSCMMHNRKSTGFYTNERRNRKISESRKVYIGEKNHRFGKRHSFDTRQKMSVSLSKAMKESWKKPELRAKFLNNLKWKNVRFDNGQLELLDKWNRLGFNFIPNYRLKSNEHLYYLDGYDSEKNVIIEYDSKYHDSPSQKEKDAIRASKIIKLLNPKKFWRYNKTKKTMIDILPIHL